MAAPDRAASEADQPIALYGIHPAILLGPVVNIRTCGMASGMGQHVELIVILKL
jgi:hypothetical protein